MHFWTEDAPRLLPPHGGLATQQIEHLPGAVVGIPAHQNACKGGRSKVRRMQQLTYQARRWTHEEKAIARIAATEMGSDAGFIVPLSDGVHQGSLREGLLRLHPLQIGTTFLDITDPCHFALAPLTGPARRQTQGSVRHLVPACVQGGRDAGANLKTKSHWTATIRRSNIAAPRSDNPT